MADNYVTSVSPQYYNQLNLNQRRLIIGKLEDVSSRLVHWSRGLQSWKTILL